MNETPQPITVEESKNPHKAIIGRITLEHPIMSGAGIVKWDNDTLAKLCRSSASAIVIGSITTLAREGNSGATSWFGDDCSLNSLGLPNGGADYYREHLQTMVGKIHAAGKIAIVSIAALQASDYSLLYSLAADAGANAVEVNLSCPNVWQGGTQKPIPSFHLELFGRTLFALGTLRMKWMTAHGQERTPDLWLKLSPIPDPMHLSEMAVLIARHGPSAGVTALVCCNTYPNAMELDEGGKPRISSADVPDGLAGMSGPALKPISLGQVQQLQRLLGSRGFRFIGAGGVCGGKDAKHYLARGASAVQVVSAFLKSGENPRVFHDILTGFVGA